jgi:hypothetical protein
VSDANGINSYGEVEAAEPAASSGDPSGQGTPYYQGGREIGRIYAKTPDSAQQMTSALDKVFSTPSAHETILPETLGRPFAIHEMPNTELQFSFHERFSPNINIGTAGTPNQYLSGDKWQPLTLPRVLAHELGHRYSMFGQFTEMGIVNRFENPIMRQFGELPRTCYPCTRTAPH